MPRRPLPPPAAAPADTTPAPQSSLEIMKSMGYDIVNVAYTTEQANQALLSRPCSAAQIKVLQKFNYDTTGGATVGQYEAAMRVIQGR